MNILYYFNDIDNIMFQWQRIQIVDELAHHNNYIHIFSPTNFQTTEQSNEALIKHIKSTQYDLFLTCLNETFLHADTIKRIRSLGIPTVLFCPDNLIDPFNHKNIANLFDVVWLTSFETKYLFEKWGCRHIIVMPYAANPYIPIERYGSQQDMVAFVGTPYGSRTNTINKLVTHYVPVALYGKINNGMSISKYNIHTLITLKNNLLFSNGRKILVAAALQKINKKAVLDENNAYLHKMGFAEDLTNVYSTYALSLSTTTARNTGVLNNPVKVVNLRSFEIPMSYGIQFCEYSEELAQYFQEDKEIVFYKDDDEMIDKANYYINKISSIERNKIRLAARKRCELEHTWMSRFNAIFKELGMMQSK